VRVLHVVTWFAPGNPFGGPARVALNDAEELRSRGHTVEVVAARPKETAKWRSEDSGVRGFRGLRLLPGAGFAGVVAPGLWWFVLRRARHFDVVHVHLARDLVTLPAAAIVGQLGVPFVAQPHGMLDLSGRRSARTLDAVLTRRVLSGASAVFALDEHESRDIRAVARADLSMAMVRNGVPTAEAHAPAMDMPACTDDRADSTDEVDVIFCSRLHRRKRPMAFVRMAITLIGTGSSSRFTLYGADEGELPAIRAAIDAAGVGDRVRWGGVLEPAEVPSVLRRGAALVLPSVDEPFGMVVAEALAAGRPVIVTDGCALAPFVLEHDCGRVVPADDHDALVTAARDLIGGTRERRAMGRRGRAAVEQFLGMAAVGDCLEEEYEAAAAGSRRS
jgi:glycosyltransferase involved in cell wall biosynthesis